MPRGFAALSKDKRREISAKGGKSAHRQGKAHKFTTDEASMAARKGHAEGMLHTFSSDEARVAGRNGGLKRAANRRARIQAAK